MKTKDRHFESTEGGDTKARERQHLLMSYAFDHPRESMLHDKFEYLKRNLEFYRNTIVQPENCAKFSEFYEKFLPEIEKLIKEERQKASESPIGDFLADVSVLLKFSDFIEVASLEMHEFRQRLKYEEKNSHLGMFGGY